MQHLESNGTPVLYIGREVLKRLKWIFWKWDERAWTGPIWLRIGTGGGHL
jgi:hypothetical protein